MDYYQGVVAEYLRADRSMFINTEFLLNLGPIESVPGKGTHWFVDLLAANFRERTVYLCEVTYARELGALLKRLQGWSANWPLILAALNKSAGVPADWQVRPWVFIPLDCVPRFVAKQSFTAPPPKITTLEMVQPWLYSSWNWRGEADKPDIIPVEMR